MSRWFGHRLRPDGPEIAVRVVRSALRKRTIALQLAPDGRVTLRAPLGTPRAKLEGVLREKTAWLEARLMDAAIGEIPAPNPPREFVAGESFYFLGRQRRLRFSVRAADDRVYLDGSFIWVVTRRKSLARDDVRSRLKEWYRDQAEEFLPDRVNRWASKMDLRTGVRVLIGDQTKRWASCGTGAVLRFNWRLMGAPVALVDYVIVHELCHLRHPNHSAAFWRELIRLLPDKSGRERSLNELGPSLNF
jgi:predicted metal-dependent hydrolase